MASARITVERGVVGFGLDYACAHIFIPASVNLLPIQADFVTERDIRERPLVYRLLLLHDQLTCRYTHKSSTVHPHCVCITSVVKK